MQSYANGDIATLANVLASMNNDKLRQLASFTDEKAPTRKQDLADAIIRHLTGDRLRTLWESLDELQQAAVAEVVHSSSNRFHAGKFRAKYGKNPNWGPEGRNSYERKPSHLCLLIYDGMMPADLKARLKAFVPAPREDAIQRIDQLPLVFDLHFDRWNAKSRTNEHLVEEAPLAAHERERAAQRELLSILRLVDAGKVAVSDATRRPSAATMAAIAAVLEGGDYYPHLPFEEKWDDKNAGPIRAFAWPMLIQSGGLAQLAGGRLKLTRPGRDALSAPPPATIRTLWQKWLDTKLIDELARIDCIKGQSGKGKRSLSDPAERRKTIEVSLADCPPGKWVAFDEFCRFMKADGNDPLVADEPWALYISEPQYGSLGYDGSADLLPGRYTMALLHEYAATLGIIDVALIPPAGARNDFRGLWGTDELPFFSRYDGLVYFRLTPLGSYCLDVDAEYHPAPVEVKPVLRPLPNLEIVADAGLEAGDRLALDAYAVRSSSLVWRLDSVKLLEAIEAGRSIQEIREFLIARSGVALPHEIGCLLDEAAERSTQVWDGGTARLLECADAALAGAIAGDPRTGKHCMRAGERILAVLSASEAAFRRALRERGYLVAASRPRSKSQT